MAIGDRSILQMAHAEMAAMVEVIKTARAVVDGALPLSRLTMTLLDLDDLRATQRRPDPSSFTCGVCGAVAGVACTKDCAQAGLRQGPAK